MNWHVASIGKNFRTVARTAGVLSLLIFGSVMASPQSDQCYSDVVKAVDDSVTAGEIRAACERNAASDDAAGLPIEHTVYEATALNERIAAIDRVEERPYALTAHRPSYLMLTHMSDANQTPYIPETGISDPLQSTELKFQLSVKAPIWQNMRGSQLDMYFAYSTTAWWQAFNNDLSVPFRETNYEPEIFIRSVAKHDFLGLNIAGWRIGFNHQSNGRSEPLSRSWNRIIGAANIELGRDLAVQLQAWYRIPEGAKTDENPEIYRYLGYGDLRMVWTPNRHTYTVMIRPSTERVNFELTWSYPVSRVFRVYAQYYQGYGESLVDYNFLMERIGIGFAFNDYLMRR